MLATLPVTLAVLIAAVAGMPEVARIPPPATKLPVIGIASCGAHSGNTARICRPGIHKRCLDAVSRGVPGFSVDVCNRRQVACSRCIRELHVCYESIGRPGAKGTTCHTCATRMSACFDRHYPK